MIGCALAALLLFAGCQFAREDLRSDCPDGYEPDGGFCRPAQGGGGSDGAGQSGGGMDGSAGEGASGGAGGADGGDTDGGETLATCDGVVCRQQPDTECNADDELLVYEPVGFCAAGGCEYPSRVETCEQGECSGGYCVQSPCQGMYCEDAPEPGCVNGKTLRVYEPSGYCDQGSCSHLYRDLDCGAGGCADDRCEDDTCLGLVCDSPPSRFCVDDTTLRVFDAIGVCTGQGGCAYPQVDIDCDGACEHGACAGDPCSGLWCNVRPVSRCADATHLLVFDATGVCERGMCIHGSKQVACRNGCADGRCEREPCAGVVCDSPPAPHCLNDADLAIHSAQGTCEQGLCQYTESVFSCNGGCRDGRCVGDPCEGVICAAPPAARCSEDEDGSRRIWYEPVGSCVSGVCTYPEQGESCDHGCENAACLE